MRVTRAFAFIDLCGFTAFMECHGDDVAVKVLAELRAGLREIAARRGVRIAKWLGDGAMLSSTATTGLVAASVEIHHRLRVTIPELSVRVGIDAGPVIMFEGDDYIGRPVNVASRICDESAPDEILTTSDVAIGAPTWVARGDPWPVTLKGFTQPVEVVPLDVAAAPLGSTITDSVCGLTIPKQFAMPSVRSTTRDGLFCSAECVEAFLQRKLKPPRPLRALTSAKT